ncbi:MAG: lactate utilization protein [Clostridia bacterium]|nr:lactate utilization protein [Clostridia bacterium]
MNIEKTLENLRKNNMMAYFAETKEEALDIIKGLISKGDTVGVGGSVTLNEAGVLDLLRNGDYNFLDRYKEGLTREEITEIFRKCFFADAYFASSNAITEEGELYNVDGNSNRVSAMLFGPKSVIVVAGKNKIVENLKAAEKRVKTVAAPQNAKRLSMKTYCSEKGLCVGTDGEKLCAGCESNDRICANYTVMAHQRIKDRVKVIIVNENLGY